MIGEHHVHLPPRSRFRWVLPVGAVFGEVRFCESHGAPVVDITMDAEIEESELHEFAIVVDCEEHGPSEDAGLLPVDAEHLGELETDDMTIQVYRLERRLLTREEAEQIIQEEEQGSVERSLADALSGIVAEQGLVIGIVPGIGIVIGQFGEEPGERKFDA